MKLILSFLILLTTTVNASEYNIISQKDENDIVKIFACEIHTDEPCEVLGPKKGFLLSDFENRMEKLSRERTGNALLAGAGTGTSIVGALVVMFGGMGIGAGSYMTAVLGGSVATAGAFTAITPIDDTREALTNYFWYNNIIERGESIEDLIGDEEFASITKEELQELKTTLYLLELPEAKVSIDVCEINPKACE